MDFTRESVFAGSFRSFCKSCATILGIALGVGIVAIGVAIFMGPDYLPPKSEPTIMPDAEGNRTLLSGISPAVLQLDFHGVIGVGDLTSEKVLNVLLDSREGLLRGDRVKAVLLHMDTPGGSASDADTIYRALMGYKQKYKIPIYAYVDGICASGGVYIACAADKIFATPSSVIGSVGVIMGPNFNFSEAMTKYGVSAITLTEGKDKDALNPFRAWKPDEDSSLKAVISALYYRFVSIVAASRPSLTKELLVKEYGAHVFIAKEAAQLGYVDSGDATLEQTLHALTEAAQIGEKDRYQVVQLAAPRMFFSNFAQSLAPKVFSLPGIGKKQTDIAELSGQFLYYYPL